jgi:Replication initiator protein A
MEGEGDLEEGKQKGELIPLRGKDEMNLVELPFGPITATREKTLDVVHEVYDRTLKRNVTRRTLITGSDAFGLPRPVDDQVLVGMNALSYEAGYRSRKVEFSRYHLCRVIGWQPDGRSYQRLEDSFNRIAGTTLQFKNAWFDKAERHFKSKTLHLLEEIELCSKDRLDELRLETGQCAQSLCYFVWNEVVWKSFQDGFIKPLDMELFRKISGGYRRAVPLRLFRILDKRFYRTEAVRMDVVRLCVGILGLCPSYTPAQMKRVLERGAKWLVECGFLESFRFSDRVGVDGPQVLFRKRSRKPRPLKRRMSHRAVDGDREAEPTLDSHVLWLSQQSEAELLDLETAALSESFGSDFERKMILTDQSAGRSILESGRLRQEYVKRYQQRVADEVRATVLSA